MTRTTVLCLWLTLQHGSQKSCVTNYQCSTNDNLRGSVFKMHWLTPLCDLTLWQSCRNTRFSSHLKFQSPTANEMWNSFDFDLLCFQLSVVCVEVSCAVEESSQINYRLAKGFCGGKGTQGMYMTYVLPFDICFEMITDLRKVPDGLWLCTPFCQKHCQYCGIFCPNHPHARSVLVRLDTLK